MTKQSHTHTNMHMTSHTTRLMCEHRNALHISTSLHNAKFQNRALSSFSVAFTWQGIMPFIGDDNFPAARVPSPTHFACVDTHK
jgi:hypothetical protein